MISTDDFAKQLVGFVVTDCLVVDEDVMMLLALEDYTQWTDWEDEGDYPDDESLEKRMIRYNPFLPKERIWDNCDLQGMGISELGASYDTLNIILAYMGGGVLSVSQEAVEFEDEIPYDHGNQALRGSIVKLKTIDDKLYLCGGNRVVAIRQGKNDWKWMTPLIPLSDEEREGSSLSIGFEDIDGFSHDDVYAVGGINDVWHYDGNKWQKVDFPGEDYVFAVCCAGDGQVYIGGRSGVVYRGRNNTWQQLKDPELSLPFKDMVWYEDRVWCTNDYGVWWIQGDEIVSTDVSDDVYVCSGNLSVRDGVLLLAGLHGAAYLQNGKWNVIFNYADMYKKCEEEGKLEGVLRARWHEFAEEL